MGVGDGKEGLTNSPNSFPLWPLRFPANSIFKYLNSFSKNIDLTQTERNLKNVGYNNWFVFTKIIFVVPYNLLCHSGILC